MSSHRPFYTNVMEFGAAGDGISKDTRAIQEAITACSVEGGGTVYFPPGHRFLTGTVYLENHITLHVAENASLLGSQDLTDYGIDTGVSPYHPEPLDRCLIYGRGKRTSPSPAGAPSTGSSGRISKANTMIP